MKFDKQVIQLVVQVVLIAGALNWGSVALFDYDFVDSLFGEEAGMYIKYAVGAAGLYGVFHLYQHMAKQQQMAQTQF